MIGQLTVGVVMAPMKDAINIYIGRGTKEPSPLRNPYFITGSRSRDECCDLYAEELMNQMNAGNRDILDELERIGKLLVQGNNVNLTCYCKHKQLRCHGDYIKEVLDDAIANHVLKAQNND